MSGVRRIVPLTVGWERLPKSYSVHRDTSGEVLVEPVPAIVLQTDDGWTLIDTGMNPALIRDPLFHKRFHGGNHEIVPILRHGMFRIDYDDPAIDWHLLDGDTMLAPGVEAIFTPGHTPGHMSFLVELRDGGGYAFTFDAADLTENIEQERGPGGFVHCEAQLALDSLLRLKAIAAQRGLPLVPGHDPVAWPALTAELT